MYFDEFMLMGFTFDLSNFFEIDACTLKSELIIFYPNFLKTIIENVQIKEKSQFFFTNLAMKNLIAFKLVVFQVIVYSYFPKTYFFSFN